MTKYQVTKWNDIQNQIKTILDKLNNATSSEFPILWNEVEPLLQKRDKMIIAHRKLVA